MALALCPECGARKGLPAVSTHIWCRPELPQAFLALGLHPRARTGGVSFWQSTMHVLQEAHLERISFMGHKPGMGEPLSTTVAGRGREPRPAVFPPRGWSLGRKKGSSFQSRQGQPAFCTRQALCSGDAQCGVEGKGLHDHPNPLCAGKEAPKCLPHATSSDRMFLKTLRGDVLLTHAQELINLPKITGLRSETLGCPSHRGAVFTCCWDRAMTEAHRAEPSRTAGDRAGPCTCPSVGARGRSG